MGTAELQQETGGGSISAPALLCCKHNSIKSSFPFHPDALMELEQEFVICGIMEMWRDNGALGSSASVGLLGRTGLLLSQHSQESLPSSPMPQETGNVFALTQQGGMGPGWVENPKWEHFVTLIHAGAGLETGKQEFPPEPQLD